MKSKPGTSYHQQRIREGTLDPPAAREPSDPDLTDPRIEVAAIALLGGHTMADAERVSGLGRSLVTRLRDFLRDHPG